LKTPLAFVKNNLVSNLTEIEIKITRTTHEEVEKKIEESPLLGTLGQRFHI
jgi:hypothetical protein